MSDNKSSSDSKTTASSKLSSLSVLLQKKVEMCLEKVCQAALWGCLCCALLCTVGFFCNTLTLAVCCRNWLKSHVFVTNWPFLMKSIPNYPQIKIFTNTYRNNIYLIVMNLRNLKNFVSWVH